MDLLSNASATGAWTTWPGGSGVFDVVGTFSGATVALQLLGGNGSTAIDIGSLTAAGQLLFTTRPGQIRAAVTSGTPSALYAAATRVP